ncbi:DUF6049 family protein [Leucobacter sp. NPDC058333]|uniref:DUF6049 family protein n=1 Tax=Leucobacter sp. NPDC058333 TaxID=3346450 RepID=UPI0036522245
MHFVPRRSARAVGAWTLSGAVLLGAVFGVSGAAAAYAAPGIAPGTGQSGYVAAETSTGGVEIVVAPREPVIGAGDDDVQFGLLIRNSGAVGVPAGTVSLSIGSRPMSSADDLAAELPTSASQFADASVGAIAAGEEQTATITVPRADIPLGATAEPGAYLVGATLTFSAEAAQGFTMFGADATDGTGDTADATATTPSPVSTTTPVVWKGAGSATVPVSVIVPFVLPSDIRTLPTRDQLADLAPGWDKLLTAAAAHDATLAIDPRLISGIRAYGDEAPRTAQLLLERLESSSLPSFLLQFADADPSAQAALGFTTLLEPTNLDFISRYGSFPEPTGTDTGTSAGADAGAGAESETATDAGADTAGETSPNTAPTEPTQPKTPAGPEHSAALPTLQELLAWPRESAPTAWPAGGRADPETIALLDSEGIDSLVLSSDGVKLRGGPRAKLGDDAAVITDAGLDAAARAALAADSETERSEGVAQLAAELVIDAQRGSKGVVLGLDRAATGEAADPAALLDQLDQFSWAESTPVAEQPAGSADLRPSGTSETRLELLRSASNRESSVNELGAVLVHPEYLSGYQRTRLLELFSTQYAADDAAFDRVAATYRKRDAKLLSGVQAISTEHIQLVGSSSRVPIQLRNSLPFDALVKVEVAPASAALAVPERRFTDVAVAADANERVLVPVRSRVSSGESGLVISVLAADGDPTVFTGTLSITIRSSFEAIAFWVLGGLAVVLLGFGIWRSVRRRRRSQPDIEVEVATDAEVAVSDDDSAAPHDEEAAK